jgi:nucleotide-binding universal stress UspA family protein
VAERLLPDRKLVLVRVDDDATLDGPASPPPMPSDLALVRLRVKTGHGAPAQAVASSLIACGRDHEAALLVVGSRGRSAIQEIVLGSVAMATLHHARRPVLVVPGTDAS